MDIMMNRILLLALLAMIVVTNGMAQRDTTAPGQTLYGKLLLASPTRIEVQEELNDGTTSIREVSIVQETVVDGCTLDSVELGVTTLVLLSPAKMYPPQAQLVKFDGCVAHVDVMATVTAISNNAVDVTTTSPSDFGQIGTNVSFQIFPVTQYISCDGQLLASTDLQIGDPVYVRANGPRDTPRAVAIQLLNDCMQTASAEGTYISVVDSTMYLLVENTADTLALTIDARLISTLVPADSAFPLYACDGSMLRLDDLKPGMAMSVSYLISPRKGLFFQYGFVKENCPIMINGAITAISGNTISVTSYGQQIDVAITQSTELQNCRREALTLSDLVVGQSVDGHALRDNQTLNALRLVVLDDCSFAFSTAGVVSAVEAASVTIDAMDPTTGITGPLVLIMDTATQVVDCSTLPVRRDAIVAGYTIVAYYRISKGARIADMVIVQDPCDNNYIGGTIQAVGPQSLSLLLDKGEVREYVFDDSSMIVNCRGELITISDKAVGSRIDGLATDASNGGYILNATVYVDCVPTGIITGTIAMAVDSMIVVTTVQGNREALRAPYSMVTNDQGFQLDWSDLTIGRQVCIAIDESTQTVLRAIIDVTCENGVRQTADGSMIVGVLQSVANNELMVSTQTGSMMFALTPATQMMDEKRNTLGAANMTPGSAVRVMSKSHTTSLTPIASTVVLLSTTRVDETMNDAASLTAHPNPASTTVTFSSILPFDTIIISNILGSHIAELRYATTFDVSSLSPGMYVVTGQRGTERVTTLMVKR